MRALRLALFAALAVAFVLGGLNLLLGLFVKDPPLRTMYETDRYRWTRLIPGVRTQLEVGYSTDHWKGKGVRVDVAVNSLGLRNEEIPREKPEGQFRILMMGDSSTFGWDTDFPYIYAEALEDMLNGPAGDARAPKRFEVMSAGVPGYKTTQGLIQLERELLPLAPDILTASYGVNDEEPCERNQSVMFRYLPENAIYRRDPETRQWLEIQPVFFTQPAIQSLNTYKAIKELSQWLYKEAGVTLEDKYVSGAEVCRNVPLDVWRANWREFAEVARAHGAGAMFILIALGEESYVRAARETAEAAGVPLFYTTPTLAASVPEIRAEPRFRPDLEHYAKHLGWERLFREPKLLYTTDYGHPNRIGHRIIAERLFTAPAILDPAAAFLARVEPAAAPALLVRAGRTALDYGDAARARAIFERALALAPEDAESQAGLALAEAARPGVRPEEALAGVERAGRLAPDFPDLARRKGDALARLGRLAEAAGAYALAAKEWRGNPAVEALRWRSLALAERAAGRWDAAADAFAELVRLVGDRPDYLRLLGEAAREARRPERAAEAYEGALALEPRDAESHCALAEIWSERREPARAAPEWRWCAELDEGRRAEAEANVRRILPEDSAFGHASGYAFMMAVPQDLVSDGGDRGNEASRLALYEDGKRLGPAHQGHDHIAERGRGRYSHFEGALFFSTSDNTDPNLNGRRYAYKIEDGR